MDNVVGCPWLKYVYYRYFRAIKKTVRASLNNVSQKIKFVKQNFRKYFRYCILHAPEV